MLGSLLGSTNKERVLIYLAGRRKGYAREIARYFKCPLFPLQNAMEGLEAAGVLISRAVGNTQEYEFNPRYPAREQIAALVDRALSLYPQKIREDLLSSRTRPRRKGKPL